MATHFGGVGNTPIENHNTQEVDNISKDESPNDNLVQQLLCKTADLRQMVADQNIEPREAIQDLEQRINDLTLTLHHQNTPIENVLDRYTETLCTAQKKTSLESSLLQDIPILNGQDSLQLEDWLTDIETASELTGEGRTKLAQVKSKTLITKALIAQKSWEEIKDSLHLKISNADIHTSISQFMDIQQTDKESLATYVHRFKWEANGCKFNNDATTIQIFLKGLNNAHTIATKVYERGPQTLSEAIKEVEKLQAAQQITSSLYPCRQSTPCRVIMIGVSNAKKLAIWHAIAHTYDATTVIIMDMWLWTAQIKYHHQAHQPVAGLAPMIEVEGSSSRHNSHTSCSHHEHRNRSIFSCSWS